MVGMTVVSLMTANFVARELDWSMADWSAGDQSVREVFRPIDTYRGRLGAVLDAAQEMGFRAIDMWEAHLAPSWATDDHIETAAQLLAERGMSVATFAGWFGTQGYDAARAIEELGDRVVHVHLKDVAHAAQPHESCAYGEGVVPVRERVEALRRIGYAGAISVEHEPADHDPTEEVHRSREQLEAWLAA